MQFSVFKAEGFLCLVEDFICSILVSDSEKAMSCAKKCHSEMVYFPISKHSMVDDFGNNVLLVDFFSKEASFL